ncbi:hypothetical protein P4H39_19935 [Paenibacillus lautus]|uniref:hypothetical protein n=1 Tax=Paenibacillus lautus TaxID=1401 RepID=UPI002DBFC96E|nr:hypothetical protein [Paenibacillus lautus]MEC0204881.1 hypothetical protein [Paenibacillus lautus]
MKRKIGRKSIFLIFLFLLFIYIFSNSGYSFTENTAIENSFPSQAGELVYEKEYDKNKTVIWRTVNNHYVKLLEKKWGILYHVTNVSELQPMSPLIGKEGDIKRTWSASLNSKEMYETIFAIESVNPEIIKVLISNDNIDNEISKEIDQIKQDSTVFIELTLEDGFAAAYKELSIKDVGGFIFRGVNDKGEIIILGR